MNEEKGTGRPVVLRAGAAAAAGAFAAALGDHTTAAGAPAGSDRYERGLEMLRRVSGDAGLDVIESLRQFSPDLARLTVEFPYGDIYARSGLDLPQRQLVTLGALVAAGDTAPQQAVHVHAALNVGLRPAQIVEAILQCLPFAGFPRVLNAIGVARTVFTERGVTP
jgi:4-carboxymuconolactone decarboxylase